MFKKSVVLGGYDGMDQPVRERCNGYPDPERAVVVLDEYPAVPVQNLCRRRRAIVLEDRNVGKFGEHQKKPGDHDQYAERADGEPREQ